MKKRNRVLSVLMMLVMLLSLNSAVLAEEAALPQADAAETVSSDTAETVMRASTLELQNIVLPGTEGLSVTINTTPDANGKYDASKPFEFTLNYKLDNAKRPRTADDVITYQVPPLLKGLFKAGNVMNGGTVVGAYTIDDNDLMSFHYNSDYLAQVDSGVIQYIEGGFAFSATLDRDDLKDDRSPTLDFPGVGELGPYTFEIPAKIDGFTKSITSSSTVGDTQYNFRAEETADGIKYFADYSLSIVISGDKNMDGVVVEDALGANLTYVQDSFKLDGAPLGAAVTFSGNNATAALGSLAAGTHVVTYTAQLVSFSTAGSAANKNNAAVKWTGETTGLSSDAEVTYPTSKPLAKTGEVQPDGSTVKWVVTVNDDVPRRDVSGLTVTDNLLDATLHELTGTLLIERVKTDGSKETVSNEAFTDAEIAANKFEYTFPAASGTDVYTFTYCTKLKSVITSDKTLRNRALLKNGTTTLGSVMASVTVKPIPEELKISKNGQAVSYNNAQWTTVIDTSKFTSTCYDLTYTDYLGDETLDDLVGKVTFDAASIKVYRGDATEANLLEENNDYVIDFNHSSNPTKFTLMIFEADKTANITVTYTTKVIDGNFEGEIKNSAKADSSEKSLHAEDTDKVVTKTRATVDKAYGTTVHSADKAGYLSAWKINVGPADIENAQPCDFGTQPLVITDMWNNTRMKLDTLSIEKYYMDGTTLTHSTMADTEYTVAEKAEGGLVITINNPGKQSFVISYQTLILDADVNGIGVPSETFTNTAVVTNGTTKVGEDTVTEKIEYTEKTLTKEGLGADAARDDVFIHYTVRINPQAADLADGDTLLLTDFLNDKTQGKLIPSTVAITDGTTGAELVYGTDYTRLYDPVTGELTLTVPDARYLVLKYDVRPEGTLGATINVKNTVSIKGRDTTKVEDATDTMVKKASAEVTGNNKTLTVHKMDEHGDNLAGAVFTLTPVSFDAQGNPVRGTVIEGKATNAQGIYVFGTTAQDRLELNTAYILEETTVPDGYAAKYTSYLILLKDKDKEAEYQDLLTKATAAFPDYVAAAAGDVTVTGGGTKDIRNDKQSETPPTPPTPPDTPDNPDKPTQPTQPTEPTTPTTPETPTTVIPLTGDFAHIDVYLAVAFMAIVGIVLCIDELKRRSKAK